MEDRPAPNRGEGGLMTSADGRVIGRLLVATPALDDFFDRSVVLILNHSDEGTQGVVLNKPLDAGVDAVLPQWHEHVSPPATLYQGGPVGMDTAMGLVRLRGGSDGRNGGDTLIGVEVIGKDVGLLDLDAPAEVIVPQCQAMRVFVGYAGWTPGQLSEEIDAGAWQVVDAEPGDAFGDVADTLWHDVVVRQRNSVAWLSTYTDDPEAN